MPMITTQDGTEIFYKDWGLGQPIVFSHGWPLSADDWDMQTLFFLNRGFRKNGRSGIRKMEGPSAQNDRILPAYGCSVNALPSIRKERRSGGREPQPMRGLCGIKTLQVQPS